MLNLWIGLCRGVPGLPRDIHNLKYVDGYVEPHLRTTAGELSVPELIISSDTQSHAVLFEWKGGANTVADQLRRYSLITPMMVQKLACVSAQAAKNFDVVVIGQAEHRERLEIGIKAGKYRFPLLVADKTGLHRVLNDFTCPKLNAVFSPTLAVDIESAPRNFVPMDGESTAAEVARLVMPKILECMHQRAPSATADVLCTSLCPAWSAMQRDARSAVRKKVCEVLEQAAVSEFSEFMKYEEGNNGAAAVHFVANPIDFKTDKRNATFRGMQKVLEQFCVRLESGRRFTRERSLFENLGDA